MRGRDRSPSVERQPRYRFEEEEEYIRRSRSRCRRRPGAGPCQSCPPGKCLPVKPPHHHHPSPQHAPRIEVRDRTTADSSPLGRVFWVVVAGISASDIMHSLAPRGRGCVVVRCGSDGRRCLLDERDELCEVARWGWLEVVDG